MGTLNVIEPKITVETPLGGWHGELLALASYARTCYQSDSKGLESDMKLVQYLVASGHESVLEHCSLTMRWVCDRGVSHELVRHRIASFSQESTRYVKYDGGMECINPMLERGSDEYSIWSNAMRDAEDAYKELRETCSAQVARSVLPNSLKTEIVVTMNYRELRHMLSLRTSKAAHPQMRQLTIPLLLALRAQIPILFADVPYDEDFPKEAYAKVEFI